MRSLLTTSPSLGLKTIKRKAIGSNILKFFRYPLVASDILSSDNSATIELFFPTSDIIVDQIKNVTKEVEVEV